MVGPNRSRRRSRRRRACFLYLVQLIHAEAAHFGFDVFADLFGRWQEAPFRLNTTSTNRGRETHIRHSGGHQTLQTGFTNRAGTCVIRHLPWFQHTAEERVWMDAGLDVWGWAGTEHSRCRCRSPCRSATLVPNANGHTVYIKEIHIIYAKTELYLAFHVVLLLTAVAQTPAAI